MRDWYGFSADAKMNRVSPGEGVAKTMRQLHQKSEYWYRGPNGLNQRDFFARWAKEVTELREKQRRYARAYFEKNKEEMLAYSRRYLKKWREKHPEESKARNRSAYAKHAERRREDARKARLAMKNDPVKLAAYRAYCCRKMKEKRDTDIQFRLRFRLRGRIWMSLQRGVAKAGRTVDLVGCSMECFKKYLEARWLPGMSWDNYGRGGWHIDHVKPCAEFDLTKPAEQMRCFHHTNCCPMWELDNLSKGAKTLKQMTLPL